MVIASVTGDPETIQRLIEQYKIPSTGKARIYQAQPVLAVLKGLGERLNAEAKQFEDMLAAYHGQELARSRGPSRDDLSGREKNAVRGSLADHIQALATAGLITAEDLFAMAYRIEEWEASAVVER